MINLQDYTYLIIFPDGNIFEGKKYEKLCNHHEILQVMREKYPAFNSMNLPYNFIEHREQIKFYNQCIKEGAIIYHSWATYIGEITKDANIYLPEKITLEQKKYIDMIMKYLYEIKNVIPHEIRNRGILEMSDYAHYIDFEGTKYVESYIEEHIIKSR